MVNFSKHYNVLFMAAFCIILFAFIFKWINFLSKNNYIIERFTSENTSHTVNLPLTTTYSCKNFCGPTARCSITGQQCFADIDCPGCQPNESSTPTASGCVPGDNDAGKLSVGVTPTYSPLTSGYGTQETVITSNMFSKPAMPNFGVDTWKKQFNEDQSLFNKRYKPKNLQNMPDYPERYSLTGTFIEDGPFAANAPIN